MPQSDRSSDRYEMLDVVGAGGMATVWRARDRQLGRTVALKRPHPAPAGSDVHARFRREARTAAAVSHPNLIEIYDVGEDANGPYLVMEFIDAPSLGEASVDASDAARIGAEVGAGLAALHEAGIVHRDVKPGNVLLARGGAKLTDFGIARSLDTTTLTQPGLTHGTPAYAAPEVLASGDHSPASDVYSLAAIVFEIVAGSRYAAGGAAQLTDQWRAVLEPALSAEPARRPTAATLASQLGSLADRGLGPPFLPPTEAMTTAMQPAPASPQDTGQRHRSAEARTAVAVFVVLLAIAGSLIVLAARGNGDGDAAAPGSATDPTLAATDTSAPSTSPPTTLAAETTAATTTPTTSTTSTSTTTTTTTTTTAPTTTAPPDEPMPATPTETRDALFALVDDSRLLGRGNRLQTFAGHLDEAIAFAAEGRDHDDIEDQLEEAAEMLADGFDDAREQDGDALRAELTDLMVHLAKQLGVDPEEILDELEDD